MYYCKNCGQLYAADDLERCDRCGVTKGMGSNYGHNGGTPVQPDSHTCFACGYSTHVQTANQYYVNTGSKSKIVAGLLGIIFGGLGVHNFYLGYTKKAGTQLGLMILGIVSSCILIGIPLMIAIPIWGFVEGIMILAGSISTDGRGIPLK